MSLILNNPIDVTVTLIWNTLITSNPKLPNDIGDSDGNENDDDEV
jgi:hypothetical protein